MRSNRRPVSIFTEEERRKLLKEKFGGRRSYESTSPSRLEGNILTKRGGLISYFTRCRKCVRVDLKK